MKNITCSLVESPQETATAREYGVRELHIVLVRVTNYTDDGYPIRSRIGVIRSNTLTQMATLARDAAGDPFFEGVQFSIRTIDEAIQRVPVAVILRQAREPGVRTVVALVGVQSNQFPRAQDIAADFLPHGIPVLIGGFHVSGMYAMIKTLTRDLRDALRKSIILVAGEVENGRLTKVLRDIVTGATVPFYDFLNPTTDLHTAPTPYLTAEDFKKFASRFGTVDTARGCVFDCHFCTIINVQGKTMRPRNPVQILELVRTTYREVGVTHFFFTDDNMARNPYWRELFAGLTRLREEDGIPFTFMMQSDLAAMKMKGRDFFPLAARAGCNQVFLGVESVNQANLRAQGKYQNQVGDYRGLVELCHSLGITTHAGYILGLDFDTKESIAADIETLKRIGFDAASFYILTPLPGSQDHQEWWRQRRWMDLDFNTYDSNHVAVLPKGMTKEELMQAYRDAWERFYSTEHMVNVLKVWQHTKRYWGQLFFFSWYLYASRIERLHAMNCGFLTLRKRSERRPGYPKEAFIPFWFERFRVAWFRARGLVQLFCQLEEVWLRSRPKSRIEEELANLIVATQQGMIDWRALKIQELKALYGQLAERIPGVEIPSSVRLWLRKRNPFSVFSMASVRDAWRYWYRHVWNPLKWIEVWVFEWVNGVRFLAHYLQEGRQI